jgi:hypothetical protein
MNVGNLVLSELLFLEILQCHNMFTFVNDFCVSMSLIISVIIFHILTYSFIDLLFQVFS